MKFRDIMRGHSSPGSNHSYRFDYSATCGVCVLPYLWPLGFLLRKVDMDFFNVSIGVSVCAVPANEGMTGTEESALTLTQKN